MFTGIIEEIGTVVSVRKASKSARISVGADMIFEDMKVGDSIAVNGVCLTVAEFSGNIFTADIMNETLSRSSLGQLGVGSKVNLERAMRADGRFGGHIVSGHIDGAGRITSMENEGTAVRVNVAAPAHVMKYVVEKGSIAIDGISLTVAGVVDGGFCVSLIPHTGKSTVLLDKKPGDTVNLENDIIGKYVGRLLTYAEEAEAEPKTSITMEFLAGAGF